jgi:gamma-glutamyltranspeptidase/glutathione hydrolase
MPLKYITPFLWLLSGSIAFASAGVVVSGSKESSEIGVKILQAGGNAADAAIAVSMAVGVTEPFGSGLGGKAVILYYENASGEVHFIESLDQSPKEFPVEAFRQASHTTKSRTFKAVCNPGLVPGMWDFHQRFGSQPWASLILPAAEVARQGYRIDAHSAAIYQRSRSDLRVDPEVRRLYTIDGNVPTIGDRMSNPDLAATLERLAYNGIAEFHQGATAHMLAKGIAEGSGWITLDDLQSYQPHSPKPLSARWNQYEIYTATSPAAGGATVLMSLLAMESIKGEFDSLSPKHLDLLGRVLRSTYPRVFRSFGDEDSRAAGREDAFSPQAIRELKKAAAEPLPPSTAFSVAPQSADELSGLRSTTHFVVVDAEGNVASITQSLSSRFGAAVIAPGTGFLLNNTMKNFALNTNSSVNFIGKGKRPRSTTSPTIVLENGRPRLALGAPGGQRIPTAITQVLSAVLVYGVSLEEAIQGTRYHLRRPLTRSESDRYVELEPSYGEERANELRELGWEVHFVDPNRYYFGGVNAVSINPYTQEVLGVADKRRSNFTAYTVPRE